MSGRSAQYIVKLTPSMIIALVDIEKGYEKDDSPRYNAATPNALLRRELINSNRDALSRKGKAYLEVALYENTHARRLKQEAVAEAAARKAQKAKKEKAGK